MGEMVDWIMESIRTYGAWSVFAGVMIESVIVPIPSPLVIMGAAFILINPQLTFVEALTPIILVIVLPGAVGSTLGAFVGYGIGFWGGKPLVERWKGFLGLEWREVDAFQHRLRGNQVRATIFFLRALPIFPLSLISAAAGFVRLSPATFILWTLYGSIPRCLLLAYLGWGLGDTYHRLAHGIDRTETLVSLFIALALIGLIIWLRGRVRKRVLKEGNSS